MEQKKIKELIGIGREDWNREIQAILHLEKNLSVIDERFERIIIIKFKEKSTHSNSEYSLPSVEEQSPSGSFWNMVSSSSP